MAEDCVDVDLAQERKKVEYFRGGLKSVGKGWADIET